MYFDNCVGVCGIYFCSGKHYCWKHADIGSKYCYLNKCESSVAKIVEWGSTKAVAYLSCQRLSFLFVSSTYLIHQPQSIRFMFLHFFPEY